MDKARMEEIREVSRKDGWGANMIAELLSELDTAQGVVKDAMESMGHMQARMDRAEAALEDPFSYEEGNFPDAMLALVDGLGSLTELDLAVWTIWLLAKAEAIQQVLDQREVYNERP